ncbi:MAG: UDP-N-acetylmuramoyl-tripeptide--D-alanyl-D-alanine ligase [Prevotellaceae bacterium]|jgi:UDP-N-acetylmuramoyl-tripeptide--D-alanyl-D-alanine ligase|nr:UDP-N-acetylmuramoyl-tripeptide--D-alanyl-D-alanine ligase [Prevotellaceae bacterium]
MYDISHLYRTFLTTTGMCTDSRKVFPGCMFFALKGDSFNGNTYAAEALARGAAYAVVDENVAEGASYIKVDDTLNVLQELAKHHRRCLALPIIAVTGTNGKTTTKELLSAVLSRKLRVVATEGNLNNHIGVPLTLLKMNNDTQIGIVEAGANHPGEISNLCRIAQPSAGLITNIGKAHLEGFGSLEGVKKTKGELYTYLVKSRGVVFYQSDNDTLCSMIQEYGVQNVVPYGFRENNVSVDNGSSANPFLTLRTADGCTWPTKLVGAYNAPNVLAAIAAGRYYGVAKEDIREAIATYEPQNHRSQLLQTASNTIIVDAYNANPTSMAAAILSFAQFNAESGSKLLILGDMLELGERAQGEHEHVAELLQQEKLTNVYLVGKHFCSVAGKPFLTFADSATLCEYLKSNRVERRLILLKGSRGMMLEKALEYL